MQRQLLSSGFILAMDLAQSSHVPKAGTRPGLSDLGWLSAYTVRALLELMRARLIFSRLEARNIVTRNQVAKTSAQGTHSISEEKLARIAYVLPRLSDRLPWRSDCLIQAIAGQNWLLSAHVASEIQIGVENPKDGDFGAHAWLVHDEMVVTGGDIERYDVLLSDSRLKSKDEAPEGEN